MRAKLLGRVRVRLCTYHERPLVKRRRLLPELLELLVNLELLGDRELLANLDLSIFLLAQRL